MGLVSNAPPDIEFYVGEQLAAPVRLANYPTTMLPTPKFPRRLAFDDTTGLPVYSGSDGVWRSLTTGGSFASPPPIGSTAPNTGAFTTLTISLGAITASTYTPTLFNSANVSASTALACQYMRVGNVVTVSGGVAVTPTLLATLTTLGVSLPIASNLAAPENLGGAANSASVASASAAVFGDATNDRATMQMISVGTGSETFYFSFTYQVI